MRKIKQIGSLVLCIAILFTMMPNAFAAGIDANKTAVFKEGVALVGSDGETFSFPKSEQGYISIHYYNTASKKMDVFDGQYESGEPKQSYIVVQGDNAFRGYCIEHGVRVDTTAKLSARRTAGYIYKGLSSTEQENLELALYYGFQSGDSIDDLYDNGFKESKYYGKNGSNYNWADWYMATQILVWEIQQGNRTESMERVTNDLGVGKDHYISIISGRPAVDIYNWMVSAIKNHRKYPSAIDGTYDKPDKVDLGEAVDGTYTVSFKDTTGNGSGYVVGTGRGDKFKKADNITITYNESTGKYDMTVVGEPGDKIYTVKHSVNGKSPKNDLLFWGWESNSSHLQTIATGAADPIEKYIKFSKEAPSEPSEGNEKPEPEYFPEFEFPVSKEDANEGWDGDTHTGMGDASLAATYVLYRDGVEVDRVTLDEYGSTAVLHDQPWTSVDDFVAVDSGSTDHIMYDGTTDPPTETKHCTVEPTRTDWNAMVTYEIVEVAVPGGRFVEPDDGDRQYFVTYNAYTENRQICVDEEENWTDIIYTVEYSSDSGNDTETGTIDSVSETLEFVEEVFVNDEYRGRIFLSKSNENEDVFNEEGSSGSQTISKNSKWKIYLKSGGYEDHPYIRFVDEGLDNSGTQLYRAVRDNSGSDNATVDLTVGTNGCLYVADLPWGTYIVEEVAADDESFVLESYEVTVEEHGNGYYPDDETKDNRYDKNIRDKKIENVIKVVKTDAETGKQVSAEDLKNVKFYIRYMGNPLLDDPTKSENYGRLLPNAADINSSEQDYTFTCNDNGEIVIPYDLEFGTYRLEEWLLPEGYFVGEYGEDGEAKSHSYEQLVEGQNKVLATNDMYDSLVTIYNSVGEKVEYKSGSEYELNEVFNYYTFNVEKQEGHLDGTEYEKYYQAVVMANNQVKGKIEINKSGEVLVGFKEEEVDGHTVMKPVYEAVETVKDAVFGIYAAVDAWLNDGNEGPDIYDSETGEKITIPITKSTHAGNLLESIKGTLSDFFSGEGDVYETGEMSHESGAKLWFLKDRDASEDGEYTRMYLTPEQKPTSYTYQYETAEDGIKYRYDVEVLMEYKAGGKNVTDINVTKVTSVEEGYLPSLKEYYTEPVGMVGGLGMDMEGNYESELGNVLDAFHNDDLYHAEGKEVYEVGTDTLIKDLGDIGVERYAVKDHIKHILTVEEVKLEERVVGQEIDTVNSVDNNNDGDYDDLAVDDGDGVYDKEGEYPADVKVMKDIKESKTVFEWENDVTLNFATVGSPAVSVINIDGNNNGIFGEPEDTVEYKVLVEGYYENAVEVKAEAWLESDENGNISPDYVIPDGWAEVPFTGNPEEVPHYVIITKEEPVLDGQGQQVGSETLYKVLLSDKTTWQDCQENGDFEKMFVQEYNVTYTQKAGNEEGFIFVWDGFRVTATGKIDGTAVTEVKNPFDVTPVIELGIGYTQETEEKITTFTANEPKSPIYLMSRDGVKTEMYYFGGLTKTILTIPSKAVEANFEYVVPMITYGTGDTAQIIDWFSQLSPDKPVYHKELMANNTVTAERVEGGDGEDVYYVVTIISDQKMASEGDGVVAGERPFTVTYADGYSARVYCAESAEGNGLGVMELGGLYKTNRYSTSDLVEILTTDDDGKAVSKLLPLGKYIVKELEAPNGFVADDTSYEVELSYKDQFTPIIWNILNLGNKAVEVEIDLVKVFETVYGSGEYVSGEGAVFGIYSAEKFSTNYQKEGHESVISSDVLVDVIKMVDESGEVRSNVKLPEGDYYIKEIATRKGYVLNETPFYFHVGDNAKVRPYEFDYASDGVSGDIFMNKYGEVVINIDTEMRYPMVTLKVDGVDYDLTKEFSENGVSNKVNSAFSNAEVSIQAYETKEVTLPNGEVIKIEAYDNTYTVYESGIVSYEYIPEVANTGYYAEYGVEFTPVKGESLDVVTDTLGVKFVNEDYETVGVEIIHTPVTKEVVVTPDVPGEDLNNDGDYVDEGEKAPVPAVTKTVGVLDKEGYQTYKHSAVIKRVDVQTDSHFSLEEDGYLALWFEEVDPQFKVELDKKGNFEISMHDVIGGALDDFVTPEIKLNNVDVTDDIEFFKSVTHVRQGNEAEVVQVKINTIDNVSSGVVLNDLEEPEKTPERPDIPYIPTPDVPSIRTSAVDSETNDHISMADKKVTIIDTVSYYELKVGKEYVVKGILMDKETGKELLVDGNTVTAETTFKPERSNGKVDVKFEFDGSELAGKSTVVFEELYILSDTDYDGKPDKETLVTDHKDIEDEKQTVYIPEIGTTAVDKESGKHEVDANEVITIVDTVEYKNLIPGEEYVMKGVIMIKETGKVLKVDGKQITSSITFTPEKAEGSVDMEFVFDGSELGDKSVVVFEELYIKADINNDGKSDKDVLVGEHEDIDDEGQTVDINKVEEEPEEEPKVEKPKEEKPKDEKPEKGELQTGIESNIFLYMGVVLLAMVVLAVLVIYRRKANNR